MTSERFKEVLETAAQNMDIEGEPRRYSGRGMYGSQCVGFDMDRLSSLILLVAGMMNEVAEGGKDGEREELLLLLKDTRDDSMGRGMVAYWPQVAWVDEDDDDDEDEDDEEDDDDNED